MDVARCVALCGGGMSFKFKIGETVKRKGPDTAEHFKVVSLLLNDYVKVRSLDTQFPTIVRADDFEEVKITVDTDP